jgi:hypothetical protein
MGQQIDKDATGAGAAHDDPSMAVIDAQSGLGSLRKLWNGLCGVSSLTQEAATWSGADLQMTATRTIIENQESPPLMVRDETAASPPDTPNPSRVFWRAETSLSDTETEESDSDPSSLVVPPVSAIAQSLRRRNKQLLELPVEYQKSYTVEENKKIVDVYVDVDAEKYMASRQMTPLQERVNALTMIPPAMLWIWFVLSDRWIPQPLLEEARQELEVDRLSFDEATAAWDAHEMCMDWSNSASLWRWLFQNMHALPSLPILITAFGVVFHMPFSFVYHWKYANVLSPAMRTDHWSRRMDQAVLHISSAMTAFGTSGDWVYFLITGLFAADSFYRQLQPKVQPKRNQTRLGLAILAWTLPVLKRGDLDMFLQIWGLLGTGLFLFVKYPIGGWSHAAFHVVLTPVMPLVMVVGTSLPASQEYLKAAAHCYALAEHRASSSFS